jgi:DNA-binding NarL/FixJ family response regulator
LVLALFSILAAIAVMALRKASAGRRLRRGQTPLNPREQQVLELLSEGLSNREIGLSLHISESTVKKHVTSTFRKLGARRRTEAARIARESGLVSD